jgi:hypothetical protein
MRSDEARANELQKNIADTVSDSLIVSNASSGPVSSLRTGLGNDAAVVQGLTVPDRYEQKSVDQ